MPEKFDAIKADLWAVGLTALEILTGEEFMMFRIPDGGWEHSDKEDDFREFTDDNFQDRLNVFGILKNPKPDSLSYLIKRLLEMDPANRASLEEIVNLPIMKKPEYRFASREE